MIRRLALAVLLAVLLFGIVGAARAAMVREVAIEGPIGPATAEHVGRALAESQGAEAVILRLDTPGGLDRSMRDIINAVLAAPVPVIGYVAPRGARAASAGTYILMASHVAAMAPGTNVGAATPVAVGGGLPLGGDDAGAPATEDDGKAEPAKAGPRDPMAAKARNDAAAFLRALAEMRGRNADWAAEAVHDAASLSARQALDQGVIDLIARDRADLLDRLDGRTVAIDGGEVTLATAGAVVEPVAADWRTRILAILTDPTIAFLLLMLGVYGLLFEAMNPGAVVPGVVGALSLVFALYGLSVLPVSFAGIALVLLGVAFMVAEAFVPSFGMLGLGGLVGFVLGATLLYDSEAFTVAWPVIAALAVTTAALIAVSAGLAVRAHRRKVTTGRDDMIGAAATVIAWQGGRGRVHAHGEDWQARGPEGLTPGQAVTVADLDGLTLAVTPQNTEGTP